MGKTYKGKMTKEIRFPLGGIGTGSIGLAGNGALIDWEVFNRPNKNSFNGFSHFAVKAEQDGRVLDARVLQGDLQAPYMGQHIRGGPLHSGYGFGPLQQTMAGMPHFQETEFMGNFPFANMRFADPCFPGTARLTAFNPLIPLQSDDSSIPAAFLEWELTNTSDRTVVYTICLSVGNPQPKERIVHDYTCTAGVHQLHLRSNQFDPAHPEYGDFCLATDAADVSCQPFWYRGAWCDNLEMFWHDFTQPGHLRMRSYSEAAPRGQHTDMGSLAVRLEIAAGQTGTARFVLGWNYPNAHNYWNSSRKEEKGWRNYYATLFEDSRASSSYGLRSWERLYRESATFAYALESVTLPDIVKEAVSANLSVLKSATCLRLTDGSFYGFEGCIEDTGSCEGSCTHVWNYAYALPYLFPDLERSMRTLDYRYNQREDGRMSFRLMLPLGSGQSDFHACADGQFGGVIKCYREWKLCGDKAWLASIWPQIKQSIEYAWAPSNEDQWDTERKGVLTGRQHHTLDMELYGANSWLTGFYLAALKAGAELAEAVGEPETARQYNAIFQRGKSWTDANLFNGTYYGQQVNLGDQSLVAAFGEKALSDYWNEETGELKYQIGEGCVIDQVVAQWHANLCGLGEIFDKLQTRQALQALYANNFKPSLRDTANTWRLFALQDEGGLVICSWPEGTTKPSIPLTYASETMTGFEYQAAAHMIQEGLVQEGLAVVNAVRDRYDGEKRNPWNEIECGSNYARSMASYSLLLAFSGFEYDAAAGQLGFHPVQSGGQELFRTIWSVASGWGQFELDSRRATFQVESGELRLAAVKLPERFVQQVSQVWLGGKPIEFLTNGNSIRFEGNQRLNRESKLEVFI